MLLSSLRQQAKDRKSDHETVRSRAGLQAEGNIQRITLRIRQALEPSEH